MEQANTVSPLSMSKRKNKWKINMAEATYDFMKVCSHALAGSSTDVQEYEAAGINVAKKLQKMDTLQAIYAETIS